MKFEAAQSVKSANIICLFVYRALLKIAVNVRSCSLSQQLKYSEER